MRFCAVVILVLTMLYSLLGAIIEETGSFQNFLFYHEPACAYDNWMSHVSEGIAKPNYNLYAPWDRQTNGFGAFHIAATTELSHWNEVINEFVLEHYDDTQDIIDLYGFPYKVVKFNDTDTNRTYYLLREVLDMNFSDTQGTTDTYDDEFGSFSYGWGLFIYYPQAISPLIITVVHPCDDYIAPNIAYHAFIEWNAMFFQIAGAGREVVWSGNYTNSSSLSDPSRIDATAYNYAYKIFCNKIRQQFSRRELSFQIHSYDWNLHIGYANSQISAGYNSYTIGLPLRDLSYNHEDMIHNGQPIMIPADSIGANQQVSFNDYYAFYNREYPVIYSDEDTTFTCNTNVDMWGFSQNRQATYTLSGWNDYDVVDPFIHIEMDELPNCYTQNNNNFKWFYAYNSSSELYDFENLYDNVWNFYSPMVHGIALSLPSLFEMNDGQPPTNPANLVVTDRTENSISLHWDRSYSYDFKTYEIMYSIEPVTNENCSLLSRTEVAKLACQADNSITITGFNTNTYFFKIRARDYNNNLSVESNMIVPTTIIVPLASPQNVEIYQQNGNLVVNWTEVPYATTYHIFRSTSFGGTFHEIGSVNSNYFLETDIDNNAYFYYITAE